MLRKQMQLALNADKQAPQVWNVLPGDVRADVIRHYARLITRAAKAQKKASQKEGSDEHAGDER